MNFGIALASFLLSSAWGQLEQVGRRGLARRIDSDVGINDMVCLDGQRALVPNEAVDLDFTIVEGAISETWGDLDLPSVLEINRFNSNIYYTNLALGNLAEADSNYGNPNDFFYAPLAEDGDFRSAVDLKTMLALSYANWDCHMEDLYVLVHAVPGSKIDVDSPLNTITIGGVAFDPTPDDYILDSDNSPIGFQIMLDMVGCDFCEDIVIQASVDGRVATTGQFPELDIALQCCPEPSGTPTTFPSISPSSLPSASPTKVPSLLPSVTPTRLPSTSPTTVPTTSPSSIPTSVPSSKPTVSSAPSESPSINPTDVPSTSPSVTPTKSLEPSFSPSESFAPSTSPTVTPTTSPAPSFVTPFPTVTPSVRPIVCFPFRHPRFFPYRVEVWSGDSISRSDNNVCSPEKEKMYGYDPYQYHPYKPQPVYPYGPL